MLKAVSIHLGPPLPGWSPAFGCMGPIISLLSANCLDHAPRISAGASQSHQLKRFIENGEPFTWANPVFDRRCKWWDPEQKAETPRESCTIITTDANELASKVHNRMPVLLHGNDYAAWLDPANQDGESLRYLFEPFPAGEMTVRPVSTFVNNARNEGPGCVENSL